MRLLDPDRLFKLSTHVSDAQSQQPSILHFIGRSTKQAALKVLFPENSCKSHPQDATVTLKIDNNSAFSQYPIFFSEIQNHRTFRPAKEDYSNIAKVYSIKNIDISTSKLFDFIYTRLLFLFVNVVCIFVDNLNGFVDTIEILKVWAQAPAPISNFESRKPRIIVVRQTEEISPYPVENFLEDGAYACFDRAPLASFYGSIGVFNLPTEQFSAESRFRHLKETLWRLKDEMLMLKQQLNCCFSLKHTARFFHQAVAHATSNPSEPFHFALESRRDFEVRSECTQHFATFLKLERQRKIHRDSLVSHVASCIIYDAYPPQMHRMRTPPLFCSGLTD